eukprot:scaffold1440_cov332-Pavlova_lutheri.AAC.64
MGYSGLHLQTRHSSSYAISAQGSPQVTCGGIRTQGAPLRSSKRYLKTLLIEQRAIDVRAVFVVSGIPKSLLTFCR